MASPRRIPAEGQALFELIHLSEVGTLEHVPNAFPMFVALPTLKLISAVGGVLDLTYTLTCSPTPCAHYSHAYT